MKAGRWKAPADSGMPTRPVAWFPTRVRTQLKTKSASRNLTAGWCLVKASSCRPRLGCAQLMGNFQPDHWRHPAPCTFPPGGQLPHTSLTPKDALCWPLHPQSLLTSSFPNTFPLSSPPDRQLPDAAVILLVFLMCLCPEGAGDLPVLLFPMRLVRKRSPVIAASSAVTNQLPGEHPATGTRPSPNAWPISAQRCNDAEGFGRILGLSVSFLKAENEEVLKNLLFILKAKIPLEFNLLVMDLKLLQTVEFFFYRGSRGSSLKRDFVANRVFVPEAPSRRCPYLAVGDRRGQGGEGPAGDIPAP